MPKFKGKKLPYEKEMQKIKKAAKKNPVEAYFLGGFHLLDKKTQNKTKKQIDKLSKMEKKGLL